MKWCCPAFKGWYEQAGERGIGVLIGRDSEGLPQFTIQYRAVDKGLDSSVKSDVPISLVIDVSFQFCPWCGRELNRWYGKHINELYRNGLKITYD